MSAGPRIDVVTIFPELVEHFLDGSLLGQARRDGTVDVRVTDLRRFAEGRHKSVDDTPYGGGDGMVLRCEPVVAAVEAIAEPGARVIALDPRGRRFDQASGPGARGRAPAGPVGRPLRRLRRPNFRPHGCGAALDRRLCAGGGRARGHGRL